MATKQDNILDSCEIKFQNDELSEIIFSDDKSLAFNADGTSTLFLDLSSCEISKEDTNNIKQELGDIKEVTEENIDFIKNNIENGKEISNAESNIDKFIKSLGRFETPQSIDNLADITNLRNELSAKNSELESKQNELTEKVSLFTDKFDKPASDVKFESCYEINEAGNKIYGAFVGGEFFAFTQENKGVMQEKWDDDSVSKGHIKLWNAGMKEFETSASAISSIKMEITHLQDDISKTEGKLSTINIFETPVNSVDLKDDMIKITLKSNVVVESPINVSSYEPITTDAVKGVCDNLETEIKVYSDLDDRHPMDIFCSDPKVLDVIKSTLEAEDDSSDVNSIKSYAYDSENKVATFELSDDKEFRISYDEEKDVFVGTTFENGIEQEALEINRSDFIETFKGESEEEIEEGRFGKYEFETSALSWRNSEKVDIFLDNGEKISVNSFETKYGSFYEINFDGGIFETSNKAELLDVLNKYENGENIIFDRGSKEHTSQEFVYNKLETINEKIRDLGRGNILSNPELEQQRVLYSVLKAEGNHFDGPEDKENKINSIYEKTFLSDEEKDGIREFVSEYKNNWGNENTESNNPEPEIRTLNGEPAKFSANEYGAKDLVRYDNSHGEFKVNSLYFNHDTYRFQTAYTYKENGKIYVQYHDSMRPLDVTRNDNYQDVSHIVASAHLNGANSFLKIFNAIGIDINRYLRPEQLNDLQECCKNYLPSFKESYDNKNSDYKFTVAQTILNLVNYNTGIMADAYASEKHSGVTEAEQEESFNQELKNYRDNIDSVDRFVCDGSHDATDFNNVLTEIRNCNTSCNGAVLAIKNLNTQSSWMDKGFSFYYHPLTIVAALPLLMLRCCVLGFNPISKNLETGEMQRAGKVRLSPSEVFKLYPAVYNFNHYKNICDLRKEYISMKGTAKMLGITVEKFEARYGSLEKCEMFQDLNDKLDTNESKLNSIEEKINIELGKLDAKTDTNNKDLETLRNNNKELDGKIDRLRGEIDNLNDEKNDIKNDEKLSDSEKESKLKDLDKKIENKDKDIKNLEGRKEQNDRNIEKLEKSNSNIEKLRSKLNDSKIEKNDLKAENDSIRTEVGENPKDNTENGVENEKELSDRIKDLEKEINDNLDKFDNAESGNDSFEVENPDFEKPDNDLNALDTDSSDVDEGVDDDAGEEDFTSDIDESDDGELNLDFDGVGDDIDVNKNDFEDFETVEDDNIDDSRDTQNNALLDDELFNRDGTTKNNAGTITEYTKEIDGKEVRVGSSWESSEDGKTTFTESSYISKDSGLCVSRTFETDVNGDRRLVSEEISDDHREGTFEITHDVVNDTFTGHEIIGQDSNGVEVRELSNDEGREMFENLLEDYKNEIDSEIEAKNEIENATDLSQLKHDIEKNNPFATLEVVNSGDGTMGEPIERVKITGENVELITSPIVEKNIHNEPSRLENTKVGMKLFENNYDSEGKLVSRTVYDFGENSMMSTKTDFTHLTDTFSKLENTQFDNMADRTKEADDSLFRMRAELTPDNVYTEYFDNEGNIVETVGKDDDIDDAIEAILESVEGDIEHITEENQDNVDDTENPGEDDEEAKAEEIKEADVIDNMDNLDNTENHDDIDEEKNDDEPDIDLDDFESSDEEFDEDMSEFIAG